jgi:hypothetical protein
MEKITIQVLKTKTNDFLCVLLGGTRPYSLFLSYNGMLVQIQPHTL